MHKKLLALQQKSVPIAILIGAIILSFGIGGLKSSPAKKEAIEVATRVEVITIKPGQYAKVYNSFGQVQPIHRYDIMSQVTGKVVHLGEKFAPGAQFKKDALLFAIESADYEAELAIQKSALAQAKLELSEEQGKQKIAEREWELLDEKYKSDERTKALVKRHAHLTAKEAKVKAAQAQVQRATANVDRTSNYAPCDGSILAESLDLGQVVPANSTVVVFACDTRAEVLIQIPLSKVGHWPLPEKIVSATIGSVEGVYTGLLKETLPDSLMAQARVVFSHSALLFGQYVRVKLTEEKKPNRYLVPQAVLRENNQLWVVTPDNQLEMLPIQIVAYQDNDVLIERLDKVAPVMKIISSYLSAPYELQAVDPVDRVAG